jgi:hypothetical protein
MTDISEKGSDFVRDLGDAARKNPLSAALIGMGVVWLFTGSRPVERAGDFVRSGFDRIPDAAGNMFEAARSTVKSSADSVAGGVTSATETARPFSMARPASGGIKPTPLPNTADPFRNPVLRCWTRSAPT